MQRGALKAGVVDYSSSVFRPGPIAENLMKDTQ